MTCNGDCFNCKFKDCIATYGEISKLDRIEKLNQKELKAIKESKKDSEVINA